MTQCWKCGDMDSLFQSKCDVPACGMKETKRTWVGLTDEEIKEVNAQVSQIPPIDYTTTTYAKAIEAKLKEKNT